MRYAIYYMPPESSPLWAFGSSVLGYDAATGLDVPYPDDPLFEDPAMLAWTAAPRQYGFHATMKAPFALADGRGEAELLAAVEDFAALQRGFTLGLKLARIDEFLALVPDGPAPEVERLADACVRTFDPFRAPLTAAERERRHPQHLSARQLENLDSWGYPYVFDEFRFHMTLTGALDLDAMLRIEPVLEALFAAVPPAAPINALALFAQPGREARFRLLGRFPFAETAA